MASGAHHALTSGGHTSVSAGKSFLVSVKEAIRMFSYKAGIRLVAAGANIELKALQQSIHLLAKLDITHAANRITITAKEEVVINGGGSFSRWNAQGIEHGTLGRWVEHAASHALIGPMSRPVEVVTFPRPELTLASREDATFPSPSERCHDHQSSLSARSRRSVRRSLARRRDGAARVAVGEHQCTGRFVPLEPEAGVAQRASHPGTASGGAYLPVRAVADGKVIFVHAPTAPNNDLEVIRSTTTLFMPTRPRPRGPATGLSSSSTRPRSAPKGTPSPRSSTTAPACISPALRTVRRRRPRGRSAMRSIARTSWGHRG
jgi:hypothetical protein